MSSLTAENSKFEFKMLFTTTFNYLTDNFSKIRNLQINVLSVIYSYAY